MYIGFMFSHISLRLFFSFFQPSFSLFSVWWFLLSCLQVYFLLQCQIYLQAHPVTFLQLLDFSALEFLVLFLNSFYLFTDIFDICTHFVHLFKKSLKIIVISNSLFANFKTSVILRSVSIDLHSPLGVKFFFFICLIFFYCVLDIFILWLHAGYFWEVGFHYL